ncbi:sensor histidine kinase [Archangium primigenium]|uniref:sensor histidine kinase n=1 Tax=[Archangium] primigenium TaxID=2792470 RepID=UPI001958797A|nr:PAS domain-containing sensor histidine kinase [Archangium primigenium]MBM7117004.1 PAS domain S-box protein [Archangium primigenium]
MSKRRSASQDWMAQLVTVSADAIIVIDDTQHITEFNQGAERIFGYTAEETIGQGLELLLPERFRHTHRRLIQHFAEGQERSRRMGERRHLAGVRKGGEEFSAEATISKLTVGEDRYVLAIILRDVSEQTQREESQRYLMHAGELLSSTSLDYDRTLSRVAQLATESLADWCLVYLGEPPQVRIVEVAHRRPVHPSTLDSMRGFLLDASQPYLARQTMEGRQPVLVPHVSPEMLPLMAQSRKHLELLHQVAPRSFMGVPLVVNGQLLGALMFISSESNRVYTARDLQTSVQLGRLAGLALENARLYQSARQAIEARDVVLSIVAHDLRNPLSAILMATRLMKTKAGDAGPMGLAENFEKWLSRISLSAHRMKRLTEDLLDVSRLQAGQSLSMNMGIHSAEALLREAFDTLLPLASDVQLRLDDVEQLPLIRGDRDRLLQVFSNLVGNALKFTPTGNSVRLGGRVAGGQVEFLVADTGPGLSDETRAHLFERFWQANPNDCRGIGLGLFIVKSIIEAHGGHVHVESGPGQGTTFFFAVPVVTGSGPAD